MSEMRAYADQLALLNRIKEVLTWEDMQPLHRNENCENMREIAAARVKQKRIDADAEKENDNTKCLLVKKILVLSDAINWRQSMRDHRQANANSVSLGSFIILRAVRDSITYKLVEDLLVSALRHNVNPFSLKPLTYPGITEDLMEDMIEYCQTGIIKPKPAEEVHLRPQENQWLQDVISNHRIVSAEEKTTQSRLLGKLTNAKRYEWMRSAA
jgi:hypothetical protein